MELTPELFEKIEFAERRKGYDTEQVETFLEQAGTALAQMLARVRHTEERAAHAESRLADAEQKLGQADQVLAEADRRVQQAEQRVQQAMAQQSAGNDRAAEEAEVEQAAKTLLMARRTAEATVNEARGQAQSLLDDARGRADRQMQEANAEAEELLRRANEQAEAEYADRRAEVMGSVQELEARRTQLTQVIAQMESRLAGYREDLVRAAEELVSLADDPDRLGRRPTMSIQADEVLPSEPAADTGGAVEEAAAPNEVLEGHDTAEHVAVQEEPGPSASQPSAEAPTGVESRRDEPRTAATGAPPESRTVQESPAAASAVATQVAEDDAEPGERTEYLDLTTGAPASESTSSEDRWGPGSWADLQAQMEEEPAVEAVDRVGTHRDRFMEELDSAVNEAVELDDDAMKAFFEGTSDSRARRFGWRR